MTKKKARVRGREFYLCLSCNTFQTEEGLHHCDCPRCPGHSVEQCDECGAETIKSKEVLKTKKRGRKYE